MNLKRPYRLERIGDSWSTVTYSTEALARSALHNFIATKCRPGDEWHITVRTGKGRETKIIAGGTVR